MSELRVGVNLLWLVPGGVGGSEEYVCRLLEGFDEVPQREVELTLFVNRRFWGAHPALANAHRLEVAAISGRSRSARVIAESTWLHARTNTLGVDLVHRFGDFVERFCFFNTVPPAAIEEYAAAGLDYGSLSGARHHVYPQQFLVGDLIDSLRSVGAEVRFATPVASGRRLRANGLSIRRKICPREGSAA